jgi:hypothetical protein
MATVAYGSLPQCLFVVETESQLSTLALTRVRLRCMPAKPDSKAGKGKLLRVRLGQCGLKQSRSVWLSEGKGKREWLGWVGEKSTGPAAGMNLREKKEMVQCRVCL